ncbi:GAF domain-containing protein [Rugamonas sp.]|uniref:GAF domain-containing protein n=1 Tax=Rugamonas sp. TaxID=1926287 RepID=UPI0025E94556|nr:GAF domain-containing protein [Rugamonas sp.]
MKQSPSSAPPSTVLIASSAHYDVQPLQQLLSRYSLQIRSVDTGAAALEAAGAGAVALILLDVTLAGSASFELCAHLAHAGPHALPVLLVSAQPSADEQQRALAAGAVAYFAIPFQAEEVAERILLQLGVLSADPGGQQLARPQLPRLDVNYRTLMAGSPDCVLLLDLDQRHLVEANRNARKLFGRPEAQLLQHDLAALCPPQQPDGRDSAELIAHCIAQVLAGAIRVFEASFLHADGQVLDCEMRLVLLDMPQQRLLHVRLTDVSARRRDEALRNGQNQLLEMIARGDPLRATLDRLTRLIEAQSDGVHCSVMLVDADNRIRVGAAPSLPAAYLDAIDGLAVGPGVGSCGTCIDRKEQVIVSDIERDPLWTPYRQLAAGHGLRACWSAPILLDQDTVLGAFAMYYRDVRSPTAEAQRLISVAAHLAGIAIARTRREEELGRHRDHLEELVAARTVELTLAKEQAEMASEELATALDNLSLTQEELVRRDKLAALGALVAGVAHELNTPIGNSMMVASTMTDHTAELRRQFATGIRRSALDAYLAHAAEAEDIITRNLHRAAELVSSFKRIAVDAAGSQRSTFELDTLVAELILPLHATVKHTALTVEQDIAPGLTMDSYPGPLGLALTHLFDNSVVHGFAGRGGGTIVIRARRTDQGEIALSLADDGAGIAAAHQSRVYDPFFTTRLGAGGSGLGLHITHNIVTGVLGGRITLANAAGAGVVFTLLLPAVAPR